MYQLQLFSSRISSERFVWNSLNFSSWSIVIFFAFPADKPFDQKSQLPFLVLGPFHFAYNTINILDGFEFSIHFSFNPNYCKLRQAFKFPPCFFFHVIPALPVCKCASNVIVVCCLGLIKVMNTYFVQMTIVMVMSRVIPMLVLPVVS